MEKATITCKCGCVMEVPKDLLNVPTICPQCKAVYRPAEISRNQDAQVNNYFICPNPRCAFKGVVYPARQYFILPILMMIVPLIVVANIFSCVSKDLTFTNYLLLTSAIIIQSAFVILATQIVLRVMGRRYCPECGIKLR